MVHVMPILECPVGASDGGYAVSDFRNINVRAGNLQDLESLAAEMRRRQMLLTLDVVVNHTSDQHEWARLARQGDVSYQDYYYTFENRDIPDLFEETMPEVFPENAPGNFTFDETMNKWVMTVFNDYQWDLNYSNPAVFIETLDIILFWANKGADIVRLDAVAFLWKKIGTTSQNEREAHLILQLFKDCCQVTAPGVVFTRGDAQNLPYDDNSFDAVACNFGMMHIPDQPKALGEAARVLKPGGMFSMTSWVGPEASDAFRLIFANARANMPEGISPPPQPDLFVYGRPADSAGLLRTVGLAVLRHEILQLAWDLESAEELFDIFLNGTVGARITLMSLDAEGRSKVAEAVSTAVESDYRSEQGYRVPAPVAHILASPI